MKAIRVHAYGGPEAMKLEDVPTPDPPAGHVLVQVKAAGINFFDTQLRGGLYKRGLPLALGVEGAGVVEKIARDVEGVGPGDRVAWVLAPGSYATHAIVPVARIALLPESVDFVAAAATIFQGLTAHYLTHSTYALKRGETCLIHSAAGGVGNLLCQIAKLLGASVIGTVSSDAKAEIARQAGADHVVNYIKQDFLAEVKRLAGAVNVVYDAVGKETALKSLACLAPRGCLAIYGEASGPVPPLNVLDLLKQGSVSVTRTGLEHYLSDRAEFLRRANDVLSWLASGAISQRVERIFLLEAAPEAHRAIESRMTAGKLLLVPDGSHTTRGA